MSFVFFKKQIIPWVLFHPPRFLDFSGKKMKNSSRIEKAPCKYADLKDLRPAKALVDIGTLSANLKSFLLSQNCISPSCDSKITDVSVVPARLSCKIVTKCIKGCLLERSLEQSVGKSSKLSVEFALALVLLAPSTTRCSDYLRKIGLPFKGLSSPFYREVLPLVKSCLSQEVDECLAVALQAVKQAARFCTNGRRRIILSADGQYSLIQGKSHPKQVTVVVCDLETQKIIAIETVEAKDGETLGVYTLKDKHRQEFRESRSRKYPLYVIDSVPFDAHCYNYKSYSNLEYIATWKVMARVDKLFNPEQFDVVVVTDECPTIGAIWRSSANLSWAMDMFHRQVKLGGH